jgi:hypothetical protein
MSDIRVLKSASDQRKCFSGDAKEHIRIQKHSFAELLRMPVVCPFNLSSDNNQVKDRHFILRYLMRLWTDKEI